MLIGIDIGTTSVKAVLIDLAGRRLAETSSPYPTRRPAPGQVEQDPEDWLRLVRAALDSFAGHGRVEAICLTSQVNTHVFADAGLVPLHPAIVWQDVRAAEAGAMIDAGISPEEKLRWLGAPIPVDASHALARMGWMRQARPDIWARTAHVLLPRDWVLARMTGVVLSDPMSAVGLVGPDLTYAADLIARLPGAAARLPPLADPLTVAGRISSCWPLAGTPVVLGMMDAWASLFGLGVAEEGAGMYLSGTSDVLGLVSATVRPEPGVITFPAWRGITLHAGPTQSGGASLDWVARLIGQGAAGAAHLAAPITAASPLFLPHLQGERAPYWDAGSRGAFAGLTGGTGPAELVAAVMEGVAFAARLAFEAVEASGAARPAVIRAGGGGFASDPWAQIRAHAFGRPLERVEGRDPGALGAAVMAGVGSGLVADLPAATRALVRPDRVFFPDPQAAALANDRFTLWKQLYPALKPISHRLAAG